MKRKTLILLVIVSAMLMVWLGHCDEHKKDTVSFTHDLQLIFNSRCIDCHGAGGMAHLNLTSYANLMAGDSDNGPVVRPNLPEQSLLYEKVAQPTPSIGERMPLGRAALSQSEINDIGTWIQEGAQDN